MLITCWSKIAVISFIVAIVVGWLQFYYCKAKNDPWPRFKNSVLKKIAAIFAVIFGVFFAFEEGYRVWTLVSQMMDPQTQGGSVGASAVTFSAIVLVSAFYGLIVYLVARSSGSDKARQINAKYKWWPKRRRRKKEKNVAGKSATPK